MTDLKANRETFKADLDDYLIRLARLAEQSSSEKDLQSARDGEDEHPISGFQNFSNMPFSNFNNRPFSNFSNRPY